MSSEAAQRHLDSVIRLYEKKLKKCISMEDVEKVIDVEFNEAKKAKHSNEFKYFLSEPELCEEAMATCLRIKKRLKAVKK